MLSIKETGEDQKSIQSTRNSSKLRLLLTQQNQQKKENYRRLPSSPASASEEAGNEKAIQTKDNLEAIKRTVTAAIATAASAEAADEVECLLVVNKAEIKTEELPASRTTASGELSQQGYNEAGAGYDWVLRNNSIAWVSLTCIFFSKNPFFFFLLCLSVDESVFCGCIRI